MAKYLLLKHYRGAPAPKNDVPMDRWAPEEVTAHIRFMQDLAEDLKRSGSSSTPRHSLPRAPSSATTARAARPSPTVRSPRPRTSSPAG